MSDGEVTERYAAALRAWPDFLKPKSYEVMLYIHSARISWQRHTGLSDADFHKAPELFDAWLREEGKGKIDV